MNLSKQNSLLVLAGLALIGSVTSAAPVLAADNIMQPMSQVKVDVQKLSTGYRASKIIGSNVVNDTDDTIGKVDDMIISPDDNKSAYVIISVGGWLGVGNRLVALPYENLRISNNKIILPGATKDGLKTLPEFRYSTM